VVENEDRVIIEWGQIKTFHVGAKYSEKEIE
jgi:hypothetical protein